MLCKPEACLQGLLQLKSQPAGLSWPGDFWQPVRRPNVIRMVCAPERCDKRMPVLTYTPPWSRTLCSGVRPCSLQIRCFDRALEFMSNPKIPPNTFTVYRAGLFSDQSGSPSDTLPDFLATCVLNHHLTMFFHALCWLQVRAECAFYT